jgi:hypothetical protein
LEKLAFNKKWSFAGESSFVSWVQIHCCIKKDQGGKQKSRVKGFAEALEPNRRKEEMQLTSLIAASIAKLYPKPTQPLSLLHRFLKTKKGDSSFLDLLFTVAF